MAVVAWHTSQLNAHAVLSNGNKTVTTDATVSTYISGRADTAITSGLKIYFEIRQDTFNGTAGNRAVGIANSSETYADGAWLGSQAFGVGCYGTNIYTNGGSIGGATAYGSSLDVVGIAVDRVNNKIWFRINGGNWNGDVLANQNPATNTGGYDISALGDVYPAYTVYNTAGVKDQFTLQTGPSNPPAGFSVFEPVTTANNGILDWTSALPSIVTHSGGTNGTIHAANGYIIPASSGRITYDPVTLATRGLWLEEARTNFIQGSDQFNLAAWQANNVTVTANNTTGPDNQTNADKIIFAAVTKLAANISNASAVGFISTVNSAFSVYVQANTTNIATNAYVSVSDGTASRYYGSLFNVASNIAGLGFNGSVGGSTLKGTFVQTVQQGFVRIGISGVCTSGGGQVRMAIGYANTANSLVSNSNFTTSGLILETSAVAKNMAMWRAQGEQGLFPSSPIVASAAANITRTADTATTQDASLVSANAFIANGRSAISIGSGQTQTLLSIDDKSATNAMVLIRDSSLNVYFQITTNNVLQANLRLGTLPNDADFNVCVRYHSSNIAGSLNGNNIVSSVTGVIPVINTARFGTNTSNTNYWMGTLRSVALYTTLTDGALRSNNVVATLPVTLPASIYTGRRVLGPFKSSANTYYTFGRDTTNGTILNVIKGYDDFPGWGSGPVTTKTGYTNDIIGLAATQNGDTIHMIINDVASVGATWNYKYLTFDMLSETFPLAETISSAIDPRDSATGVYGLCEIVYRSTDSQPVAWFPGPRVAGFSSTNYKVRTGVGTWSAAVVVDPGTASVDFFPTAIAPGASGSTHFVYLAGSGGPTSQRTLTSANALQTAVALPGAYNGNGGGKGWSLVNGGTTKVAFIDNHSSTNNGIVGYFDSASVPTMLTGGPVGASGFLMNAAIRVFTDGTDFWALYARSDNGDVYVAKSSDGGATWGTEILSMTATTIQTGPNNDEFFSFNGLVYQRGTNIILPYVVNDNGTWKFNEYTIRSANVVVTPTTSSGAFPLFIFTFD